MNIDCFSPLLKRTTLLFSLMAGSLLMAGCGGGSDKKSSASSSSISSSSLRSSFSAASVPANGSGIWPSVKVEAQNPKILTFQWSAVEGATFYKLFKHDAVTGGVVQIGGDLTTTQATDEIGVHVHDWVNNYYYVEACNAVDCSTKSDLAFTATEMIKAIGYIKASNTEANDLFGWSVALSADGTTLAVGAPAEDSKAVGVNGTQADNNSNNSGAVYVFVKENGIWVQQAYLKASNTEQPNINPNRMLVNDRFGYKVSLSDDGNTLAVSALLEDSPSYGINCRQDNYESTDYGSSASSSDPSDDLIAASDFNVGAVYLFNRAGTEWSQNAYVKPYYSALHAFSNVELRFGETMALSGDGKTLAVGATSDGIARSGVINFNNLSSSTSSRAECLEFYPPTPSSTSSTSSSSSSKSSRSSSTSSYDGGTGSGAVYIFRLQENGWKDEGHVKASNARVADAFGTSVALSLDGNTMIVGAIGEDSNGVGTNSDQSNDSCYYLDNTSALIIDTACEEAGRHYYRGNIDNGAAYIFSRAEQTWTQDAYLKPSTTFWSTRFGYSVDISADGLTASVGAPGDASKASGVNGDSSQSLDYSNTGAAYIFRKSGTTWAQEAFIKPSTLTRHSGVILVNGDRSGSIRIDDGGQFGGDVSLSQDGNTLAVGSYRESSNAKGINGDEGDTSAAAAGAVFVFKRDNTVWMQQSYVKASNTDSGDRFGLNVDLTADGKTMAVGAHRESGRGYAAASSGASTSSAASEGALDQSDNNAAAAGAVYVY